MTTPLLRHLAEYEYLREQLQAEYREADEDTLRDTLEGISSLPEALATVVRSYLDDLTFAAALGIRISEMQDRLSRIEQRAEKKRGVITAVMERADIRKLVEPDFTASLRAVPPSLLVMDEREVPAAFWRPQAPKLDRRALIAALGGYRAGQGADRAHGRINRVPRCSGASRSGSSACSPCSRYRARCAWLRAPAVPPREGRGALEPPCVP